MRGDRDPVDAERSRDHELVEKLHDMLNHLELPAVVHGERARIQEGLFGRPDPLDDRAQMMRRRAILLAFTLVGLALISLGSYSDSRLPLVLIGSASFVAVAGALTVSSRSLPSQSDVFYVIGVFDMLGQKRRLHRPMTFPPKNNGELQQTRRNLQETAASVRQFRELFQGQLNEREKAFEEYEERVPEAQRAQFRAALAPRITTWGFSDTYCVAIPLEAGSGAVGLMATLANVCRLLEVAAETWLVSLGNNEPIRGGIEIGPATSIHENEVYGLALAEAHGLESTVAEHPRIVVGGALVRHLEGLRRRSDADLEGVADLAQLCRSMLRADMVAGRGQVEIDVLGSWATPERRQRLRGAFASAHHNVRRQLEEHQKAGDKKLISRYEVLLRYFDGHAERWRNSAE